MTSVRVAFFGNVANNFHVISAALREHGGVDAHLYLDARETLIAQPESDEPLLRGRYPRWMHRARFIHPTALLAPWRAALTRELASYDLIVASGIGPVFAQFTGRPWCFYVTGGDLTAWPFPIEFRQNHHGLRAKVAAIVVGVWQRRGIRRATEVWMPGYAPYLRAASKVGLSPARVSSTYFPLIIDVDKFRLDENARQSDDATIRGIVDNFDFVLFHPSRLMIRADRHLIAMGHWKRNEVLLEGFGRFLDRSGAKAVLVMPDRSESPDIALAKEIVARLGIIKNVTWLRPPRPEGFTRHELIPLYSIADAVADDFGVGWFGSVTLEALSMSRPVISYIDARAMQHLYPWHPMLSARSAEEVAGHLADLYARPDFRADLGLRGRRWVETFHSMPSASAVYARQIMDLAERFGVQVDPPGKPIERR